MSSNRLKFCWLKVICCICQSNELQREIKQKLWGPSKRPTKRLGVAMAHPGPPRTATVALTLLCDARYSTMEKSS